MMNGIDLTEKAASKLTELKQSMIHNEVYPEFMEGVSRRSNRQCSMSPTMRIAPSLIITKEEIDQVIERIQQGSQGYKGHFMT